MEELLLHPWIHVVVVVAAVAVVLVVLGNQILELFFGADWNNVLYQHFYRHLLSIKENRNCSLKMYEL